jgi:hypothetical protein
MLVSDNFLRLYIRGERPPLRMTRLDWPQMPEEVREYLEILKLFKQLYKCIVVAPYALIVLVLGCVNRADIHYVPSSLLYFCNTA